MQLRTKTVGTFQFAAGVDGKSKERKRRHTGCHMKYLMEIPRQRLFVTGATTHRV